MALLTLTTDFGESDYYVAAFKGAVLSQFNDVDIVDVSHQIPAFDINQAAFVVKHSWTNFPPKTVHVIRVGEYSGRRNRYVAASYKDQFFIAPDNGLLSLAVGERFDKVVAIDYPDNSYQLTDFLAKITAHVLKSHQLDDLGQPMNNMDERLTLQPVIMEDVIRGTVIHIDHYGNLITNIDKESFENNLRSRRFEVLFRGDRFIRIADKYSDVVPGEKVCFFNSSGTLQISINQGNASQLLGLRVNDVIQIDFL